MLEDGPTTCEHCGGPLRRVFHPAGIIFKGSGFYRNDSRTATGGSSERAAASKPETSSDGGGGAGDGSAPSEKPKAGTESSSTPSKE